MQIYYYFAKYLLKNEYLLKVELNAFIIFIFVKDNFFIKFKFSYFFN